MSEWIEYTGSDEQIRQIKAAKNGFMVRGDFYPKVDDLIFNGFNVVSKAIFDTCSTHFLLCQPHPYADLIKIWADTGCPVYIKLPEKLIGSSFQEYWDETKIYNFVTATYPPVVVTATPDWNIPDAKYSLTLFEDQS